MYVCLAYASDCCWQYQRMEPSGSEAVYTATTQRSLLINTHWAWAAYWVVVVLQQGL
jgi:hypothetical protein